MIKQKKAIGFAMAALITIVGIAFSAFILAPLISSGVNFIRGGGESQVCTLSLFQGKGIARCPIDDVIIYDDRVEIKYGTKENYEELMEIGSRTADVMVKEALARLLRACLQKGGGLNSKSFANIEGITCLECATLSADEGSSGADDILRRGLYESNIANLKGYLEQNKPTLADKSYMGFLTRDYDPSTPYIQGGHSRSYIIGGIEGKFYPGWTKEPGPSKDYVIFYMGIMEGKNNFFENIVGKVGAFYDAITFNVGDLLSNAFKNDGVYFTYITESSNLGNICQRKVN